MLAINKIDCKSKALLSELRLLIDLMHEFSLSLVLKLFHITYSLNNEADALSRQHYSTRVQTFPFYAPRCHDLRCPFHVDLINGFNRECSTATILFSAPRQTGVGMQRSGTELITVETDISISPSTAHSQDLPEASGVQESRPPDPPLNSSSCNFKRF